MATRKGPTEVHRGRAENADKETIILMTTVCSAASVTPSPCTKAGSPVGGPCTRNGACIWELQGAVGMHKLYVVLLSL